MQLSRAKSGQDGEGYLSLGAEQPATPAARLPERCVRPRHDAQGPFGSGNHARAGLRPARPLSGSAQGALAGLWAARAAAGQWQAAVVAPTLLVQKRRRLATCVLLAFKQSTLKIDCATRESKMNSAPDWGRGPARTLAGANQPRAGRAGKSFPFPSSLSPSGAPLNPFDHDRKRQRCEQRPQPVCGRPSPSNSETGDGADNLEDRIEDGKHTQRPTIRNHQGTRSPTHQGYILDLST